MDISILHYECMRRGLAFEVEGDSLVPDQEISLD